MAIYGELDTVIFVENIPRLKVPFGKIVMAVFSSMCLTSDIKIGRHLAAIFTGYPLSRHYCLKTALKHLGNMFIHRLKQKLARIVPK